MKIKFLFLFILPLLTFSSLNAQQCTIKEETWQIKTYPFSDPDPVPILVDRPEIYPYFKYQKYSTKGKNIDWKVIVLENDYIKVLVLPGVGGKVYGAIEKSTNQEFIYYNKVLKFRQIAMRGPWTSGGSEFNFGLVGHTPTVATPVDFVTRENSDGSISCFVGTMDLTSRTRWTVEVRLPKDKAFFETRTTWYNPTPFNQSYYSWSNNAVKAGEDLEYFYPGKLRRGHGYSVPMLPWPVDKKGRNLSFYKNNNFGSHKSHFVTGAYENFFGGYWHDSNFGFGHWSLYDDMPGKKMWIWAQSRQGAIWENLLSDTDGQYSEPQSGRLFSQDDHEFFPPYTADNWKEIFFPFKDTGGMVKATPYGILNIEKKDNSLQLKFCPLQSFTDDLLITDGKGEIQRETISFKAMEVIKRKIPVNSIQEIFNISISDKIKYTSDLTENEITRPYSYHVINESTTESIYLAAERLEKNRKYDEALKKYFTCINNDPYHLNSMVRAAEIYSRKTDYQRALSYAGSALQLDMYNPDANYIFGIISRNLSDFVNAKETFGWAARSMKYRANAYCQLAEINLIENNHSVALDYIQKSIDYNNKNSKPKEVLAILLRKLNKTAEAIKVLSEIQINDPLNHLATFELYLNQPSQKILTKFKSNIQTEIPHETYLEMAITYNNLGLEEEAIKVLENCSVNKPTIQYWLAYLNKSINSEKSRSYLDEANQASPQHIFPFRSESIPVFKWAIKSSPEQWKSYYYLGLIYWSKGKTAEANELFKNCDDPEFAPFYITQAHFNTDLALPYYIKALKTNEKDWRNWHFIVKHYNQNFQYKKALDLSSKAVNKFQDDIVIQMDYAISLYNTKQYDKCLKKLINLEVLPYEGGWEAHDLFKKTNIHLAMEMMKKNNFKNAVKYLEDSKKYPELLGTGKPYDPDYRLQDYLRSICYKKLNDSESEKIAFENVRNFTIGNWGNSLRHNLFGYITLRNFGELEKANQLLNEWQNKKNNLTYQWYLAKLKKNQIDTLEIEKKQANDSRFSIVVDVVKFLENEGYL